MWIRKTNEELEAEKNKYSLKTPIGATLLCFVLIFFTNKIGLSKFNPGAKPLDWGDMIDRTPFLIFTSIGIGLLILLYQVFFLKDELFKSIESYATCVCLTCNKTSNCTREIKCECGGDLEYLKRVKWIKEEENSP